MTRPTRLVFEGSSIKVRCEQRRVESGSVCVVDWWRWTQDRSTVNLAPLWDSLPPVKLDSIWDEGYRLRKFNEVVEAIRAESGGEAEAIEQANVLACEVAAALGPQFKLGVLSKGHDFYKHRIPLLLNDQEVASVMCWSSSQSPRQLGQVNTLNVNIHGTACTFAAPGWEKRIHAAFAHKGGRVTTGHLAVDFFDGIPGGIEGVHQDYLAGVWDHYGKRPKIGDVNWLSGHSRSLYMGSKECGKQTNVYEKGDQLYGHEEAAARGIKWIRAELRFGNKLRFLDWDMLIRPGDFFAGASAAHEALLNMAVQQSGRFEDVEPENVPCHRADAPMTVQAEVARVVRWSRFTAGAAFSTLVRHMDYESLLSLFESGGLPRRLRKFSSDQLDSAFKALDFLDRPSNDSPFQKQPAQLLAA
jgi:phage replication initiation protein